MILPVEDTCEAKNKRVIVLLISITFLETMEFLWMPYLPVAWPVSDVQQFLAFLF